MRTPYNYDRNAASVDSGLFCRDPTLTQQHQAVDADINTIVKRFGLTGELPQNVRMPLNADFDSAFDFHTAHNLLREAEEAFMKMPARVRSRFDNDPGRFVSFASDPANLEECRKLGLAPPAPKEEPRGPSTLPPSGSHPSGDQTASAGRTAGSQQPAGQGSTQDGVGSRAAV